MNTDAILDLNRMIGKLKPKHQLVLRRRFFENASLADIAFELDRSIERVRTVEIKALHQLRFRYKMAKINSLTDAIGA